MTSLWVNEFLKNIITYHIYCINKKNFLELNQSSINHIRNSISSSICYDMISGELYGN